MTKQDFDKKYGQAGLTEKETIALKRKLNIIPKDKTDKAVNRASKDLISALDKISKYDEQY